MPKEWIYSQISGIDDVDYIMDLIESEKEDVADLYPSLALANEAAENKTDSNDTDNKDDESVEEKKKEKNQIDTKSEA